MHCGKYLTVEHVAWQLQSRLCHFQLHGQEKPVVAKQDRNIEKIGVRMCCHAVCENGYESEYLSLLNVLLLELAYR